MNKVWNILSLILLVLTMCVVGVVLTIYVNPYSSLNPFPPPTLYPSPVLPTPTRTLRITLEPSWTPTISIPTMTPTIGPTHTPLVTTAVVDLTISDTPEAAVTVTPGDYDFVLKDGNPLYIAGETFHPELECNWVGVAGQVLGLNEEPISNLFIHLGGSLENQDFNRVTITGTAPVYGSGGYEFIFSNLLVGSTGTLWVQLEELNGLPMSERIYFDTHADCTRNLALIYFLKIH